MPSKSYSVENLLVTGPRIVVKITPSSALLSVLSSNSTEMNSYSKTYSAIMIVDTGASCSMVDSLVAQKLGLVNHGEEKIVTPSGERDCLTFDINIVFIGQNKTFHNLGVAESNFRNEQGVDGLIGRDILKSGLLVYQGESDQFTLAF